MLSEPINIGNASGALASAALKRSTMHERIMHAYESVDALIRPRFSLLAGDNKEVLKGFDGATGMGGYIGLPAPRAALNDRGGATLNGAKRIRNAQSREFRALGSDYKIH